MVAGGCSFQAFHDETLPRSRRNGIIKPQYFGYRFENTVIIPQYMDCLKLINPKDFYECGLSGE
jgi:hypothetical protein